LHRELGPEAIVSEWLHRSFVPFGAAVVPIHHHRGHLFVAVGEHVSFDDDRLAGRALDWKSPAINPRGDVLDDDSD
jgi:hypothetical protein